MDGSNIMCLNSPIELNRDSIVAYKIFQKFGESYRSIFAAAIEKNYAEYMLGVTVQAKEYTYNVGRFHAFINLKYAKYFYKVINDRLNPWWNVWIDNPLVICAVELEENLRRDKYFCYNTIYWTPQDMYQQVGGSYMTILKEVQV